MDSGWVQAIIAGVSAVIAVGAAIFSLNQARSAKRQADAAHGDVDPTFHLEPGPRTEPPAFATFVATNYNKRDLRLVSLALSAPPGCFAYPVSDGTRELIGRIMAAVSEKPEPIDLTQLEGSTLRGLAPNGGDPVRFMLPIGINARSGHGLRYPARLGADLTYQMLGNRAVTKRVPLSVEIEAPDDD